ncbi:MAG: biotin/lipoyl-binding protein [Candidatus Woesebacteria bacterium]
MTLKSLKTGFQNRWKKVTTFIDKRPFGSFFILLGLLLVLIVVGNFLRKPAPKPEQKASEPKLIETYSFGESPKMTFAAKIEKSGVISIIAQVPGIVQKVNLTEGQKVSRGGTLVSLSTNYQGGNAASLGRQIAQKSFDSTTANFDLQMDIINRQKDLAGKGNTQGEELRDITRQSLSDTQGLIDLNQDIVNSLDAQITQLTTTNVNGANDAAIAGAKQGKAAAQAGLNQLRSGLRVAQYQSDENRLPAQIATASGDLTVRQLDLQARGLTLANDLSELNLKLAKVSEGLMYPASPCSGVVERIYVKVGQNVSPGTVIATIKADQGENTAVVLVPRDIAKLISTTETSDFLIGGKKVSLNPRFVSTEATEGSLYSVLYAIPSQYASDLVNAGNLEVHIPMGSKKIVTDNLYIPLDSVYQTQDKSYVYIKDGDKAAIKEIAVGNVSGSYVKVNSGLASSDTVITSRSVQEGDHIRTE